MLSIESPQSSILTGFSELTGKKSTIPPRWANCPGPSTISALLNPAETKTEISSSGEMVVLRSINFVLFFNSSGGIVSCNAASAEQAITE